MKKWKGLLWGVLYGLAARAIFSLELSENPILPTSGLMSLSFLFVVPFVIGLICAYYNDTVTKAFKIVGILMPLFSIIGMVLVSVVFGWEGIICALIGLPVFAIMSLIGGFIGVNLFIRNKDKMMVSFILLLPFFIAPVERYFGLDEKIFTEKTSIIIKADEGTVWRNITRVKTISEAENRISLFQVLGFPRPIRAELDTIAVGGIRKAIFDRGLFFTETVTEAAPLKVLKFTIKADPESTPPTALDKHVMVGGKFFDIMEGKYQIEKISDGNINLHLTSRFRLSTSFNFYAGLWSKLIMRDIQKNILQIIKDRSERVSSPSTSDSSNKKPTLI
jgi:hypothetical protein